MHRIKRPEQKQLSTKSCISRFIFSLFSPGRRLPLRPPPTFQSPSVGQACSRPWKYFQSILCKTRPNAAFKYHSVLQNPARQVQYLHSFISGKNIFTQKIFKYKIRIFLMCQNSFLPSSYESLTSKQHCVVPQSPSLQKQRSQSFSSPSGRK